MDKSMQLPPEAPVSQIDSMGVFPMVSSKPQRCALRNGLGLSILAAVPAQVWSTASKKVIHHKNRCHHIPPHKT